MADRFEDLITWQLLYRLSVDVWKLTRTGDASRDFDYRDQIREASDSAHRNVAEGFARYNPGEFLRFLDVARASAQETRALLQKGRDVRYLTDDDFTRLDTLARRGLQALARFQRYLRTSEAKRNAERQRHRKGRTTRPDPNATKPPNASNNPNDPNDPNVERSERSEPPNDPNISRDPASASDRR
jgi:four helix bundle protein